MLLRGRKCDSCSEIFTWHFCDFWGTSFLTTVLLLDVFVWLLKFGTARNGMIGFYRNWKIHKEKISRVSRKRNRGAPNFQKLYCCLTFVRLVGDVHRQATSYNGSNRCWGLEATYSVHWLPSKCSCRWLVKLPSSIYLWRQLWGGMTSPASILQLQLAATHFSSPATSKKDRSEAHQPGSCSDCIKRSKFFKDA